MKTPKARPPSRIEQLRSAAVRAHVDLATTDILRRRAVLCEQETQLKNELAELTTRIAYTKDLQARIAAEIDGLSAVLESR